MADRIVIGSVVNECSFEISKSSLNNLNRFQKRISDLRKQLGSLTTIMSSQAQSQIKAQQRINKSLQTGIDYFNRYEKAAKSASIASGAGFRVNVTTPKAAKAATDVNKAKVAAEEKAAAKAQKIQENAEQRRNNLLTKGAFDEARAQEKNNRLSEQQEQRRNNILAKGAFDEARMQKAAQDREERNAQIREARQDRIRTQQAFAEARAMSSRRDTIGIGYSRTQETMGNYNLTAEQQQKLSLMLQKVSQKFESGAISAKRYNYELGKINRVTRQLGSSNKTLMETLDGIHNKLMLGGAALGVYELGKGIAQLGMDFEGYEAGLTATTGSQEEAAKTMEWLKDTSFALGVNVKDATHEFMSLTAAGRGVMSMGGLKDLFEGYTEYAKALDVDTYRYQLGLLALNQMLSKGVIQSQEARRQLGENIAGSYQLLQKAVGMTGQQFDSAMRSGSLLAKDVLPKLTEQFRKAAENGGGLAEAVKNTRSEFARLYDVSAGTFATTMFNSGFGKALSDLARTATYLVQALTPLAGLIGGLLKGAFETFLFPIRLVLSAVLDLADLFGVKLDGSMVKSIGTIAGVAGGIWALVKAFKMLKSAIQGVMALGFVKYLGKLIGGSSLLAYIGKLIAKLNVLKTVATAGTVAETVTTGAGVAGVAGAAEVGGTAAAVAGGAEAGSMAGPLGAIAGAIATALGYGIYDYFTNEDRKASSEKLMRDYNARKAVTGGDWSGMEFVNLMAQKWGLQTDTSNSSTQKHVIDINVHDGEIKGLVDASIREDRSNDDSATDSYSY